jgi:repressor LexA
MAIGSKSREALRFIRNQVMHSSRVPSIRELQRLMGYKSPRSALLLFEELVEKGYLAKRDDGSYRLLRDLEDNNVAQTVLVPLVGIVTCGAPILAEENVQAHIPVSTTLISQGYRYFLLKAKGDSMDMAGINDGDLVLVRQQPVAENGNRVVALIDDEATVKIFQRSGDIVSLLPKSSNHRHQPIIVTADLRIQGLVTAVIPSVTN